MRPALGSILAPSGAGAALAIVPRSAPPCPGLGRFLLLWSEESHAYFTVVDSVAACSDHWSFPGERNLH